MKMKLYTTLWENETIKETVSEPVMTDESKQPRAVEMQVVNVYPQVMYQKVEGFGGAMTDTGGSKYSTSLFRRRLITFCLRVGSGW